MDAFERWVRGGLELRGVEVTETDVEIMRYVESVFGPMRDALFAANLGDVAVEAGMDPSRPPR